MAEIKLYHVTKAENAHSIEKEGLKRRYSNYWQKSGGAIYLSETYDNMEQYGDTILEVTISSPLECYSLGNGEHICFSDIGPERIRRVI